MKKLLFILYISALLVACHSSDSTPKETLKDTRYSSDYHLDNWLFWSEDESIWRTANVPGSIHLDLWRHHMIEAPFYGTNELKQQWVEKRQWIYRTYFSSKDIPSSDHTSLVFEGLDTHALVLLNDSLILHSNNMFTSNRINLDGLLKAQNVLEIYFFPSEILNDSTALNLPYRLPDNRVFSRKAPYHFGWDWGPKFVTVGIWKPVYIQTSNVAKIQSVHWETEVANNLSASVIGVIEVESYQEDSVWVTLELSIDNQITKQDVYLKKGLNNIIIKRDIPEVKLWYPVGMGEPYLYDFKLDLKQDNHLINSNQKSIGFRTIELVQDIDSIGQSFYFKINGKPLFIRGANYIPQDNFLSRVDTTRHQKLIESVRWANMNMIRVWGGGIYEDDAFYDLCDQKGILIWQDFMFACAMYPGDEDFMVNVYQEVTEQVKRLRHHASIALWCGNNEVDNGWKDWGWQQQFGYSVEECEEIWSDYINLFTRMIPDILRRNDSSRYYHPSSPTYGWGHPENFQIGDSHYWGVWWGHEPFSVYNQKVGRFMSEYGFQSMPNMSTIDSFCIKEEQTLFSETLKSHQKHPTGYETILEYMEREYPIPQDLQQFVYCSQMLQAEGMKIAIEAHRRAQPNCMGTLYWQLNDCWPVCSWSSIDYYYRKKALHYWVRDLYKPVILSSYILDNTVSVYGISNDVPAQDYQLKISQIDFKGDTLSYIKKDIHIDENSSRLFYNESKDAFTKKTESYLVAEISTNKQLLDVSYLFFETTKQLGLPKTQVHIELEKSDDFYFIHLFSDVFVKDLALSANIDGEFSENYFCLPAKQKMTLKFFPKDGKTLEVSYRCMNDL